MRPNNEFTSPDHRFFYPANHPVEHHESFDTSLLPGTINIPGVDRYVVINSSDGVHAAALENESYNLRPGSTIVEIKGRQDADNRVFRSPFIKAENFSEFDESCGYKPEDPAHTFVIVQAFVTAPHREFLDAPFDDHNVAILPYSTSLPSFAEEGIPDEKLSYRLLGVIDPNDKLVTWHGETSYTTLLVDWCVANAHLQNRLEQAMLFETLPNEGHLVGMLNFNQVAQAYLKYFDQMHGTTYLADEDPRRADDRDRFTILTEDEFAIYTKLGEQAFYFMTHPRQ